MQDNSFKKNIEQELHGLSIEPSQKVWLAVEKELDKEKRRYFPVWWWLFFLLIGGSGLVWYMGRGVKKEIVAANEKIIPVATQQRPATTIATKPASTEDTLVSKTAASFTTGQQTITGDAIAAGRQAKHSPGSAAIKITGAGIDDNMDVSKKSISDKAKQKVSITAPATGVNNEEKTALTGKEEESTINNNTVTNTPPDSAKQVALLVKETEDKKQELNDTMPTLVSTIQNKKKTKWIKEWSVSGGMASFVSLKLAGGKNEYSNLSPGPGTVDPQPPVDPIRERNEFKFRQGTYFQAGIHIGRPISKKISWLTGLHYNFQQVKVDRKSYTDSFWLNGTGAYTNIRTSSYKESINLHSINVPLLLKFRVNKHIDINAGIYNNILISSSQDKYSELLGKQKSYQAMLHFNPSLLIQKWSVGPFMNIGLRQYAIQRNMINYGLQLKYIPKK